MITKLPAYRRDHTHSDLKSACSLQDTTSGELFASVTYASPWTAIEPVLDSSRYFVLRVEGDGGKRAYIGMGFEERGEAFDFQVSWRGPRWEGVKSIGDSFSLLL